MSSSVPPTPSPEQRDVLLSRYLDGELDPADAGEVQRRIGSDDDWQEALAALKSVDERVHDAIAAHRVDEPFIQDVAERVAPTADARRQRQRRIGLLLFAAGIAAVVIAVVGWKLYAAISSTAPVRPDAIGNVTSVRGDVQLTQLLLILRLFHPVDEHDFVHYHHIHPFDH